NRTHHHTHSFPTRRSSDLHPRIEIVREEATTIPREAITIIATGPLTSATLTDQIMKLTGDDQLYFYDAIAPIIAADSIDQAIARSEEHTSELQSRVDLVCR